MRQLERGLGIPTQSTKPQKKHLDELLEWAKEDPVQVDIILTKMANNSLIRSNPEKPVK